MVSSARYSTPFELNNSTNSRKSLLSGIGMAAVAEFDDDLQALLRGHGCVFPGVRFFCLFEAPEDTNRLLHVRIIAGGRLGARY